jgi:hypothetical protein
MGPRRPPYLPRPHRHGGTGGCQADPGDRPVGPGRDRGRLPGHPGLRPAPADGAAEGPARPVVAAQGDAPLKPTCQDWRKVPRPKAAVDKRGRRRCGRSASASMSAGTRTAASPCAATSTSWTWSRRSGWRSGFGRRHRLDDDPQGVARIAAASNHPAVLPLVHNSANAAFNGPAGRRPAGRSQGPRQADRPAWPTWPSSAATAAMSSTSRTCRPRGWRTPIPSCSWTRPARP